jgi:hypothetical protein
MKIYDKSKTYDKKPWQLATNTRDNRDDIDSSRPKLQRRCCMSNENLWQLAMKVRCYCHGGQNAIFFQQTIIDIVTMALSLKINKLHDIWYYHITL